MWGCEVVEKHSFYFIFFLSIWLFPIDILAGAWVQEKGRILHIYQLLYYQASQRFDRDGNRASQPDFQKVAYQHYYEKGFTDKTTLGFSPFIEYVRTQNELGPVSRLGMEQLKLFARHKIWQDDHKVASIQGSLYLPAQEEQQADSILPTRTSVELKLLGGYSFDRWQKPQFLNAEIGYVRPFTSSKGAALADLSYGIEVRPRWQLILESINRFHLDLLAQPDPLLDQDVFSLHKIQFSVKREMSNNKAIQFGFFHHLHGKNTGQGGGIFISLWKKL